MTRTFLRLLWLFSVEFRLLVRRTWSHARRWRWLLAGWIVFLAVAALAVWPSDRALLDQLGSGRGVEGQWPQELAQGLSFWGDFPTGTLMTGATVWLAGYWRRSRRLRQAAVACVLAATVAGLSANLVRLTSGRPRPSAKLPDGFYGPGMKSKLQSFPSGHCATSFGTAVGLSVALPPLAVPALVAAGGVAWSRMYLERHFPTDALVGSGLGVAAGVLVGSAARRRRIKVG